MKTDDLISAIAQDGALRGPSVAMRMTVALVAGGLVAGSLFVHTLGIRPDIANALQTWRFPAKVLIALSCLAAALWAAAQLARPDASRRKALFVLALPIALLAVAMACELLQSSAAHLARARRRQQLPHLHGIDPGAVGRPAGGPARGLARGRAQLTRTRRRGCRSDLWRARGNALCHPLLRRFPSVRRPLVCSRRGPGRLGRLGHRPPPAALVTRASQNSQPARALRLAFVQAWTWVQGSNHCFTHA